MLEIKDIVKTYRPKNGVPVQALKSVSVKFNQKGLVFILGKSGCGKSTLLNCIGGLDKFDSGEIIIKGKSSKEFTGSDFDSYRNTFIGFIFQEYNILSEFNIEKNIALALELQGKDASKKEVQRILDMVDLGNMGKRKTNELSGGQKQRVAIARALIKDPEIIIADEPTGALDSATGIQVFDTLKKLAEDKLVIVVSHDREFAEIYGDRIIEMKDGVIISDETKRKVEPNAISDDLTMIGEDMIHIKKGHKFSPQEKDLIIKFLESRDTETIISVDEQKNQKFKQVAKIDDNNHTEKFTETTEADKDTKAYNKNELKLIKSRLKFKDSFKIGASSLKTKPVRLAFTILLSLVAFTIFGVVDALSTFNRPKAVWDTVNFYDSKTVSLSKKVGGAVMPWSDEDIDLLKEKFPEITVKKIAQAGVQHGSSSMNGNWQSNRVYLNGEGLVNDSQNVTKVAFHSGKINVTKEELNSLGFTLKGDLPVADNEIAISKHMYDCFADANKEKITSQEVLLSTYNKCYFYENNQYRAFTIVGIVDDKADLSKYENITTEELNKDYELQEKIANELSFGFVNMLYVSKGYYENALAQKVELGSLNIWKDGEYVTNLWGDIETLEGYYNKKLYDKTYEIENAINLRQYGNVYENGKFISLDNSVILSSEVLENILGYNYNSVIESGNTKIVVKNSEGEEIKQLTVVGYFYNSNGYGLNEIITSTADMNLFNGTDGGVKFYYDGSEISGLNGKKIADLKTVFESTDKSWAVSKSDFVSNYLSVQYLKSGVTLVNGDNFADIGVNNVILPSSSLSQIGSGDELNEIIEAGLTIELKFGWGEKAPAIFTFNVVGISNGEGVIVSNKTMAEQVEPLYYGFDYAIAMLTDNTETNKDFIYFCETLTDSNIVFPVQNGATPILDNFGDMIVEVASIVFYVGIGFAVFAALLLMNFISTSISYKKREIGILRALGARGSDVFGIFFNESLVIALINFVLASIATIVASNIISASIIEALGLELVLLSTGIRQIALILGVSVLTAFVASLLPVSKIAKKQPIDAINNR